MADHIQNTQALYRQASYRDFSSFSDSQAKNGKRSGQEIKWVPQSEKISSGDSISADSSLDAHEVGEEGETKLEDREAEAGLKMNMERQRRFFIRRLPDLNSRENRNKLMQFLRYFQSMSMSSAEALQQAIQDQLLGFGDISHQFAALSIALEAAEEERLKEAFKKRLQEMEKLYGPAIRAALNISNLAMEFTGGNLEAIPSARQSYQESVHQFGGITQTYSTIVEKYGEDHFQEAISFLIKACGHDLSCPQPSADPVQLKSIRDDLYQVQVLGNVHLDFSTLLETMKKQWSNLTLEGSGHTLMQQLLPLSQAYSVDVEEISHILHQIGLDPIDHLGEESTIYFLTQFLREVRRFPMKIYEHQDKRENILHAIQLLLDNAIDAEIEEDDGDSYSHEEKSHEETTS